MSSDVSKIIQSPQQTQSKSPFSARKFLLGIFILFFLSATAAAGYFYFQYQKVKQNPAVLGQEEVKRVNSALSQFLILPEDEEPTIANVVDREKLGDQPFFAKAKNGDQLIIYPKSAKAIIYRPSENKIVDFTLINAAPSDETQTLGQNTQNQPAAIKVALYNGTATAGLTKVAEEKLSNGFAVTAKQNAVNQSYEKTMVIVLDSNKKEQAETLAKEFGAEVSSLPDGEQTPKDSELLVILGSNFAK